MKLTFETAFTLAVVMLAIAFINRGSEGKQPKLTPGFFGLVVVFLVLASFLPAVMVPIGIIVVLWQGMNSAFPEWLDKVGRGPAA